VSLGHEGRQERPEESSSNSNLLLQNITLSIKVGEKVGICGRSGG